jgi:hypothetical protein
MANLLPPIPQDEIKENFRWREWFRNLGNYIQVAQTGGSPWTILQGGTGANTAAGARTNLGLGTMATQNSNLIDVTGGSIGGVGITGSNVNSTPIGVTTPNEGHFTSNLTRNGYTVKPNCYIEAYDLSASIALTSTPTLLTPASTGASSGITYNNSTGVFTFSQEGDYTLALFVNAIASASGQFVYIYAEKNTGSGWTVNANSGKFYALVNGQTTQIAYANAVHRAAGEQTRYWIYSNDGKVTLQTQTLPSVTGVYVPAIRIQYS